MHTQWYMYMYVRFKGSILGMLLLQPNYKKHVVNLMGGLKWLINECHTFINIIHVHVIKVFDNTLK